MIAVFLLLLDSAGDEVIKVKRISSSNCVAKEWQEVLLYSTVQIKVISQGYIFTISLSQITNRISGQESLQNNSTVSSHVL